MILTEFQFVTNKIWTTIDLTLIENPPKCRNSRNWIVQFGIFRSFYHWEVLRGAERALWSFTNAMPRSQVWTHSAPVHPRTRAGEGLRSTQCLKLGECISPKKATLMPWFELESWPSHLAWNWTPAVELISSGMRDQTSHGNFNLLLTLKLPVDFQDGFKRTIVTKWFGTPSHAINKIWFELPFKLKIDPDH